MIRFDPSKITFEIVRLKAVSTALGGSVTILPLDAPADKKDHYKRVTVPLAVARGFIVAHKKMSKFLKPIYTCITRYDGMVISLESHPLGMLGELEAEGIDGKLRRWEPASELNFQNLCNALDLDAARNWYFDGRYMYSLINSDVEASVRRADHLTSDGTFRKVVAQTFDLQELGNHIRLVLEERSCLAIITSRGDITVSPPIWKKLEDVGTSQLSKAGVQTEDGVVFNSFDEVDTNLSVNLNFALKAGQEIGEMFGHEFIEPLHLPQLMIELCTVNLPNVSAEIKASYPIGMPFTHAVAWMLGMLRRADTLQTAIAVRNLLKYLTKRGIFRKNMLDAKQIFRAGKTVDDVKVVSATDVNQHAQLQLPLAKIIEAAKIKPHIVLKHH
jgi:hypothetical protein